MTGIAASLRFLLSDLTGADDCAPPAVPNDIPAALQPVVAEAIARLIAYQGPSYAQLYLQRLHRFSRRRDVDAALLGAIARLMVQRMCYDDPIHIAQRHLLGARDGVVAEERHHFLLDELVGALPGKIGRPLLLCFERTGWMRLLIAMRFCADGRVGRQRLRLQAGLRRWRLFSVRYGIERAWVERWLHMIDRSLTRQPVAAMSVAETATMIQGSGEAYRRGLADWHVLIDRLVKPVLDGGLALPDLAAAVAEVRADNVEQAVLRIRARVDAGG